MTSFRTASLALSLFGVLVVPAPARAEVAPRIDATYPPPRDVRRPDRTTEKAGRGPIALLAFTPNGRSLATAGPAEEGLRVWNARTGSQQPVGGLEATLPAGRVLAAAFGADGATVTVLAEDLTVSTWEVAGVERVRTATLRLGKSAADRPELAAILAGAEPRLALATATAVGLWNPRTGEPDRAFEGPFQPADGKIRALAFRADGKVVAAASERGTIRLWDTATGKPVRTLRAGPGLRALALHATHLAAASADGTVTLWEIARGAAEPASTPSRQTGLGTPVVRREASREVRNPLRVLQEVEGEAPPRRWRGHPGAIAAIALSSKGGELATAGGKSVRVWDVASGKLLCAQEGHTTKVTSVAFNPNGQKMVAGAADGSLRTFTVPLPPLPEDALAKITAALPAKAAAAPKQRRRLLVFWRADAILHKGGVPAANAALELLGKKTGAFETDFTRDYEVFDRKRLARYDAIVLNSTAHIVLPDEAKKQALLDYVRGGGGVVGIHAAMDTFKGWPEGAEVVGATFGGHPWNPSGSWAVKLEDPAHPLLRAWTSQGVQQGFKMKDEFYELADPYRRADRKVLLSLDLTDPATAGVKPLHRTDRDFAVSWIKPYGKGRVFYCMFGHIADPFWDPRVLTYYLDGIQYALGDLDPTPATN